jgi:hypothetical protein
MTLYSILADDNVAGMREDRLRSLVEPLGYTVTRWQYDGGQTIHVKTPRGTVSGSSDWGDRCTASGVAFARLAEAGLVPEGVMECVIPARY